MPGPRRGRHRGALPAKPLAALLATLLLSVASPRAGEVAVRANIAPASVPVGEAAVLQVIVTGDFQGAGEPQIPAVDGLTITPTGTSQNLQWINGRMSGSLTYSYQVVPARRGIFRIGPIQLEAGGRRRTAGPVTLRATAPRQGVPAPGGGSGSRRGGGGGRTGGVVAGKAAAQVGDQSIFVRARVDRDTVYVNQQVTWTLEFWQDGRVALARSPSYTPPETPGLWKLDLPGQRRFQRPLHGRVYTVTDLRSALFPTAPGRVTIGPARIGIVTGGFGGDLLDEFFGRPAARPRRYTLATDSITVTVLPLPRRGRPAGFRGAVASDLHLTAVADKREVKQGDPVDVVVSLSGTGNMAGVALPELPAGDHYKVYPGKTEADTTFQDGRVAGRKSATWVVVPQRPGSLTLPALSLPYFDPEARRYRIARTPALQVQVLPADEGTDQTLVVAGGGGGVQVIRRDVRYIHPVPHRLETRDGVRGLDAVLGVVGAVPVLAVLAGVGLERRRRRLAGDVAYARAVRAWREARCLLDQADRRRAAGDPAGALDLAGQALRGYFADRLNRPRAGVDRAAVVEFLRGRGTDPAALERAAALWDGVEAARFGGGAAGDAADLPAAVRRFLAGVEKEVRR